MLHGHLFASVPAELPSELTEVLVRSRSIRIERIVSRGHATPDGSWYDQSEHEFVLLVSGEAGLEVEGHPIMRLLPGAYIDLPAHTRHRVTYTASDQDTVWLAIFYSPG